MTEQEDTPTHIIIWIRFILCVVALFIIYMDFHNPQIEFNRFINYVIHNPHEYDADEEDNDDDLESDDDEEHTDEEEYDNEDSEDEDTEIDDSADKED